MFRIFGETLVLMVLTGTIMLTRPAQACDWLLTPEERSASVDDEAIRVHACSGIRPDSGWTSPQSVAGPSGWNSDCHPSLTADGMTLYFCGADQNGPPYDPGHLGAGFNIYCCHWDDAAQKWGEPEWLGPNVNPGSYPTISPDGQTLYFSRSKSVWLSIRDGDEWTEAVGAPQPINDDDPNTRDGPVSLSADGLKMFVASERPEGSYGRRDIWQLTWDGSQWTDAVNCGPGVNTEGAETHPAVSPDGSRLYFSDFGGDRPGPDFGGPCLFYSEWTGSEWGEAVVVPAPVNTDMPLCSAFATAGGLLYLGSEVSEGGRGEEDIWITSETVSFPDTVRRGGESGEWMNTAELEDAWYVHDMVESDGAIYAGTAPNGDVFRTTDGGESWSETAEIAGAGRVYSLLAASDGSIYAGTYPEGKVYRTIDEGESWEELPVIPYATAVRALLETSEGDILAATSPDSTEGLFRSGRIFRYRPQAPAWERLALLMDVETGVYSLLEVSPGLLFGGARCYGDNLYVSPNGGESWIIVDLPYDNDHVTIACIYFFCRAEDNERIWMGGWAHGPQGILLSSRDNGLTWEAMDVIENGDLIVGRIFDMIEADNGDLFIGVHPGPDYVAMRSTDAGLTWERAGEMPGTFEVLSLLKASDGTIYAGTTPNGDVYKWATTGAEDVPCSPNEGAGLEIVYSGEDSDPLILFTIPKNGMVELSVYDPLGRKVATILDGYHTSGSYDIRWDRKDRQGRELSSGIYFIRLRTGTAARTARVTVVR